MGIKASSWVAWDAVRGKPSRMNEAEGSSDVRGGVGDCASDGGETKASVSKSESWEAAPREVEFRVNGDWCEAGNNQPRVLSSWRIRRRIMASGTRDPERMVLSALMPGIIVSGGFRDWERERVVPSGVWFLTLSRRRSPELMAESWGKRWRSRSACVPFPTPGAPTRIILAALESFIFFDFPFLVQFKSLKEIEMVVMMEGLSLTFVRGIVSRTPNCLVLAPGRQLNSCSTATNALELRYIHSECGSSNVNRTNRKNDPMLYTKGGSG